MTITERIWGADEARGYLFFEVTICDLKEVIGKGFLVIEE